METKPWVPLPTTWQQKAFVVLGTTATVLWLCVPPPAHADPYCGSGSNYDWRHDICQPGAPVPPGRDSQGVGVFPYPMPGQPGPGGYGQLPYGGN